jgi:hypothetical protein
MNSLKKETKQTKWLKWYSNNLASLRLSSNPRITKKKKKRKTRDEVFLLYTHLRNRTFSQYLMNARETSSFIIFCFIGEKTKVQKKSHRL